MLRCRMLHFPIQQRLETAANSTPDPITMEWCPRLSTNAWARVINLTGLLEIFE
jgi:hypothetical protein